MPAFALTIFTGAFLLFQVQPLIGKFILPWYGGGPAVWTTCMLFFQVFLLGGYAWAHFSARRLTRRNQAIAQLVILAAALALMPITPGEKWKPGPEINPTLHILGLLAANLGLAYFLVSTTGPLMQEWYSLLYPGAFPYRLYALSNVGSLLALVSYPFLVETRFTRCQQATFWGWGLVLYGLCLAACAWKLYKANPARRTMDAGGEDTDLAPSAGLKMLWIALPACASALLLATTNKICQDVAVIPFLWIVPLALYLLSFIIAFDSPRWYRRWLYMIFLTASSGAAWWVLKQGANAPIHHQLIAFSTALFFASMVCHGELFRLKPHPRHLTSYYLMISAGGAIGGIFVAVIAPQIFVSFIEFHWSLWGCWLLLLVLCLRDGSGLRVARVQIPAWSYVTFFLLWLGGVLYVEARGDLAVPITQSRNFYGTLRVFEHHPENRTSHYYLLKHGRITHGMQFLDPEQAKWPTTYFCEESGVGLALRHYPRQENMKIGVVGLGTGTLAAYGKKGDSIRIYEINPDVKALASSHFHYVADCPAKVDIIMGDARLSMEREPPQDFDVLILDAFSSDAIPVHLLTREAFGIYMRHVRPDGIFAVHISNRYLDLQPVVDNLADHYHLKTATIDYEETDDNWWNSSSTWALMTKNEGFLKKNEIAKATSKPKGRPNDAKVPLWTDDFASLFQILEK
jgi:spermidine synthase